ncbi:hypothetical protein A6302_04468 [Methylobrevis pamukkalensis]|uniref:Uncharacterized protein n=1 Tax=Methylobrevis pamukkalensis TaxID=1439726 RepID=A0A1E3GPU8_9HYPH|nr:hypothetical protein A6302_04468 [Methylobrevis pamukkalensis]
MVCPHAGRPRTAGADRRPRPAARRRRRGRAGRRTCRRPVAPLRDPALAHAAADRRHPGGRAGRALPPACRGHAPGRHRPRAACPSPRRRRRNLPDPPCARQRPARPVRHAGAARGGRHRLPPAAPCRSARAAGGDSRCRRSRLVGRPVQHRSALSAQPGAHAHAGACRPRDRRRPPLGHRRAARPRRRPRRPPRRRPARPVRGNPRRLCLARPAGAQRGRSRTPPAPRVRPSPGSLRRRLRPAPCRAGGGVGGGHGRG